MTVTIKRKSMKKRSKKNERSRNRNSKTKKTIRNMSGGGKVKGKGKGSRKLPHSTKKVIKSTLLEAHSKKTPIEIHNYKQTQEWSKLKSNAYNHIKGKMKNKNFKEKNIIEIIKTHLEGQGPKKLQEQPLKVLTPQPFNSKNLKPPEGIKFFNTTTRNYITPKVYEIIKTLPEGTTIKSAWNSANSTMYFYTFKTDPDDPNKITDVKPLMDISSNKHVTSNPSQLVINPNYNTGTPREVLTNPLYSTGTSVKPRGVLVNPNYTLGL